MIHIALFELRHRPSMSSTLCGLLDSDSVCTALTSSGLGHSKSSDEIDGRSGKETKRPKVMWGRPATQKVSPDTVHPLDLYPCVVLYT